MSQYYDEVRNMFMDGLQQHSPTVSFDEVWDKYNENRGRGINTWRAARVPIIAFIILLTVFTAGFASHDLIMRVDKTDYPFVEDQEVIGKWKAVDFVEAIKHFNPKKVAFPEEPFYLSEMVFVRDGSMLMSFNGGNLIHVHPTWTKGLILNKLSETASKYEIRNINGQTYMFMEWKSGDYTYRGKKPQYYVFWKVDSMDYSKVDIPTKDEMFDYSFIDNPKMHGTWQSVDYVRSIEDFKPGVKSWTDEMFLIKLVLEEKGELSAYSTQGEAPEGLYSWTAGLLVNNESNKIKHFELRDIDGKTYMFLEWRNEEIFWSRFETWYYVFEKVE